MSVELRAVVSSKSPSATPTSAAEPTRAVSAGKGFGVIWEDDGRTIPIEADTDLIRLVLQDDVDWTVQADPSYLQLQQAAPLIAKGFTARLWMFRLLRSGETTITASGASACPPLVSCERRTRSFSVTLKIG